MALNANALFDKTYFEQMWQGEDMDTDRIEHFINAVSTAFEKFCNRPLIQRTYTYEPAEDNPSADTYYSPEFTIFDAPPKTTFWFPTYPVSDITYFEISGIEVSVATDFEANTGYMYYIRTGKLVYAYGFDYPYKQNVRVKWTGGYAADSPEISHLRYLAFNSTRDLINSPQNMTYESEKIGQYQYKTIPTYFMKSLEGLSPKVFSDLSKYRREAIG